MRYFILLTAQRYYYKQLSISILFLSGSDTLNKWHHLASQNVRGGLNISEEGSSPPSLSLDVTVEADHLSVVSTDKCERQSTSTTDDEQNMKRDTIVKDSTPNKVLQKRILLDTQINNLFGSTPKKSTIITRSSSALTSLRKGRKLLTADGKDGRSKAEVIEMIANAMSKVNVEAKAEKRILKSLTESSDKELGIIPRNDYKDMPNVSKVLEKAAHAKSVEEEEVSQSLMLNGTYEKELKSKGQVEGRALDSVLGPLGLINRADPLEPDPGIMNRLLRFSVHERNVAEPKPLSKTEKESSTNDTDAIRVIAARSDNSAGVDLKRNKSSGSLVEMVMNTRTQITSKPVSSEKLPDTPLYGGLFSGLTTSNTLSSNSDDSKQRETSKSVETGLDSVKNTDNSSTSSYGGWFSFLGKLS